MSGATNKAEKLDHTVPLARAEVNRVGSEWLESSIKADAYDPRLHIGFDPAMVPDTIERVPQVGEPPLPEPPRPPPALTEAQLRDRLREALAHKAEADTALAVAAAALDRAIALRAERQQAVDGYRDLDGMITQFTVQSLRVSGRSDLPPAFRDEIAARDEARVDLDAAVAAVGVLTGEHGEAASHAAHRGQLAQSAAVAVMNCGIVDLVEHHREALAAVEDSFKLMASFDRFVAATGVPLPFAVAAALRAEPRDHRRYVGGPGLNVEQWRSALAALMADPLAEIEIEAA